MNKALIAVSVLSVFVAGCDGNGNHSGGMMGGGGMMDNVVIKGGRAPQETKTEYLPGFQQAQITCSQCHIMPNPNQHTRAEWPDVIARMMGNIKTFKRILPNDNERNAIIDYYVVNAQ